MEKELPKWKPIRKGEKLPSWAFLMKMDGTVTPVNCVGIKVGQDAYYLPVNDVIEEIKNYPIEESEDEKIKQELIEYHKAQAFLDGKTNNKHVKFVAWLEKQGEHDSIEEPNFFDDFRKTDSEVEPKFKVGDIIRHKEQGCTCKITTINTATAEYEVSECSGTHLPFDFQDAWGLVEQKPAEWSEEDERIKNNLLSELTNLSVRKLIEKETEKKYASWLKILKDRYTWKPSKRQIQSIRNCALNKNIDAGTRLILDTLYQDLLKLRGK